MQINFIFAIIVLIVSVILHEISHGYAAYFLGDPTAKYQGRLSLNPLKHIDMFGSVIFPAISYMLGGPIFGWAKPVPYNPYNLKGGKWGEAIVAVAGPASNIFLALVFSLYIRTLGMTSLSLSTEALASYIVLVNIYLAIFNLIPIPPLDGSRILASVFPLQFRNFVHKIERYSFIVLIFFIVFLATFIQPVVSFLFHLFTGLAL
ncbi:MAG: site-2 protease family protein [bacterium]